MLGHLVTGMFSHPNEAWFLYDEVRSGAVHCEDAPAVDWDTVRGFAWTVRTTLNQHLSLTSRQNIGRRAVLLMTLDQHHDQTPLVAWLRVNRGPIWSDYLGGTAERSGGEASFNRGARGSVTAVGAPDP